MVPATTTRSAKFCPFRKYRPHLPRLHQNWSDQPFTANVASWYWGHGRIGPYSIVWFDFLAVNGTEFVSAYAAKDGEIVVASCASDSIRVRPTLGGINATYPPHLSTPNPSGYTVTLDLGAEGVLDMNVSVSAPLFLPPIDQYTRSVGNITGRLVTGGTPGELMSGIALFEQFKMTE